ncbi:MAG: adenylosuccinate lyase [Bdellovibrionales bacterium RIFCSPHIGHO2_01_FULL_40_29]|nr:MAG: adenylosuccinate lyase [Bdellovibrionales bacterium RIFCSPHIGHO2_01_FULL_40_29]OFZ35630.1 MAG: adenylosuccinate lyase [Bdellovibrionales bacterium RIFCSPHIGHO2_02_FULL_40_15]
MIERYSTVEMTDLFSMNARFNFMKDVEIVCAEVQADLGIIPKSAAKKIKQKAKFQVLRIMEIEKETKHDVIAFVTNLAENVGPEGRFIHFGLTSSDVLDTAMSLQINQGLDILLKEVSNLEKTLLNMSIKYKNTICAGRTHGIYAEVTTFGFKLAGFLKELQRNKEKIRRAQENIKICKLSGAVGTLSALPLEFEVKVAKKLGFIVEPFATQVIPRDRHAEVILSLTFLFTGLDRLAIELRHLQRSEVGEVVEGFQKGQKGSSAMPHKKNPISAENISGLARLMKGYAQSALDNISLWHERDISHSSVERVIFPDAFQLAHYGVQRMNQLLQGLYVNTDKMLENTHQLGGVLYSSHLLLHLVEYQNLSREEAYKIVQSAAHSLKPGEHLQSVLAKNKLFDKKSLQQIFSGEKHLKSIEARFKTYLK